MSLLKDKHLQKALQHAPDSDVAPSDAMRKTVLDYANKTLKPRSESWFTRGINAFNYWQLPRWQLAGMGSLAASLLVVVIIWHENPDDPMQVATAPTEVSEAEPELAQGELARDDLNQAEQSQQVAAAPAPESASAEIAAPKVQDKMEAKAVAKNKLAKQEIEALPQVAAIDAPSDQVIVASAPELTSKQDAEKDPASVQHKQRTAPNESAPIPAPVAAAPASASAEPSADAMSGQETGKSIEKMPDAEARSDNSRSEISSAAAAKPALTRNITLAQAISLEGGKALANKDFQAGNLRILYLSKNAPEAAPLLDEATGYRIELITDDAVNLVAEVAAYNQTMREWHLKKTQ